jgi:hypothetical protein
MGRVNTRAHHGDVSRDPTRPWAPSPFARFARTHALSVAGDAIFTVAMAGTVFFSVDVYEARGKVAALLVFTVAPFAVAAPLIGPALDRMRGGRKWMIVAVCALRALVAALLIRHYDSWLFYLEGFLMLALSKGYVIARGAFVPTVVRSDEELVEANSKLTLLSGLSVVAAAPIAGILFKLGGDDGGPALVLGLATLVFAGAAVLGSKLPSTRVAEEPPAEAEIVELRGARIRLAATSMALVRGVVGFLSFLMAFYFKAENSAIGLGVAAASAQIGVLAGAATAPRLRRSLVEERIFMVALGVLAVTGVLTALMGGLWGAALVALGAGVSSNIAKQSFDSLVQRDAPDANRGRSFARFETRFQLVWVLGALIPVALRPPLEVGFVFVAVVAGGALVSYDLGMRRIDDDARRQRQPRPQLLPEPSLPRRRLWARRSSGEETALDPGAVPVAGDAWEPTDATLVLPDGHGPPPLDVPEPGLTRSEVPAPEIPDDDAPVVARPEATSEAFVGPTGAGSTAGVAADEHGAAGPVTASPGLLGLADEPLPSTLLTPEPAGIFDPVEPTPVEPERAEPSGSVLFDGERAVAEDHPEPAPPVPEPAEAVIDLGQEPLDFGPGEGVRTVDVAAGDLRLATPGAAPFTYPEPAWRTVETPPLPGFEALSAAPAVDAGVTGSSLLDTPTVELPPGVAIPGSSPLDAPTVELPPGVAVPGVAPLDAPTVELPPGVAIPGSSPLDAPTVELSPGGSAAARRADRRRRTVDGGPH